MKDAALFPDFRVCCACNAAAPRNVKAVDPRQPSIVGLNITIYRRTKAGRQLRTTKTVMVCESCLSLALASLTGAHSPKASLLASALFGAVARLYNAMCEAK